MSRKSGLKCNNRADYETRIRIRKSVRDVSVLVIYYVYRNLICLSLIMSSYHLIFMNEWILTRFLFCSRSSLLFYLRYSQNSTVEKVSDLLFNLSFCSFSMLYLTSPSRFFLFFLNFSFYRHYTHVRAPVTAQVPRSPADLIITRSISYCTANA